MTKEERARVIVEAVVHGDTVAAERNGVSTQSIRRWRKAMADDPELSMVVAHTRARASAEWAEKLDSALSASCDFIERAAEVLDPADAGAVRAMTKALGTLAEVQQRKRILDERLGE